MAAGKLAILTAGAALAAASVAMSLPPGPPEPAALVQSALAHLREGRDASAEQVALEAAGPDQGNHPRAWLIVATARHRQGRFEAAIEAYQRYLEHCTCPRDRQFTLDQIQHCRRQLQPGMHVRIPSEQLTQEQRGQLAQVDDQTYTHYSDHFIVHARNEALAQLVSEQAERALGRICQTLLGGQEFPHLVEIHVWPNQAEFRKHAVQSPEWAGGSYTISSVDGVMTRRIDVTQLDDKGRFSAMMLDRVLPHELCHLAVSDLFGDVEAPLFLNEGLATLAEFAVDNQRVELAGTVLGTDKAMGLRRLILCRRYNLGNEAPVFYAESFSLVEFLHSRLTPQQFRDFLTHLKSGCSTPEALQRAMYLASDERFFAQLEEAWRDHAIAQRQILQALRGDLVAAGQ